MEDTKVICSKERETYVPADLKVIEIKVQGIICTSIDPYNNGGGY